MARRRRGPDLSTEKVREKVRGMYRYMVMAAIERRAVPYLELANVFGESRVRMSYYAAWVGDICKQRNEPPLNCLIIDAALGKPNQIGFGIWLKDYYGNKPPLWGDLVSECWAYYSVPALREAGKKFFSGSTAAINQCLDEIASWQ